MDLAAPEVEVDVIVGEHARKRLDDAVGLDGEGRGWSLGGWCDGRFLDHR